MANPRLVLVLITIGILILSSSGTKTSFGEDYDEATEGDEDTVEVDNPWVLVAGDLDKSPEPLHDAPGTVSMGKGTEQGVTTGQRARPGQAQGTRPRPRQTERLRRLSRGNQEPSGTREQGSGSPLRSKIGQGPRPPRPSKAQGTRSEKGRRPDPRTLSAQRPRPVIRSRTSQQPTPQPGSRTLPRSRPVQRPRTSAGQSRGAQKPRPIQEQKPEEQLTTSKRQRRVKGSEGGASKKATARRRVGAVVRRPRAHNFRFPGPGGTWSGEAIDYWWWPVDGANGGGCGHTPGSVVDVMFSCPPGVTPNDLLPAPQNCRKYFLCQRQFGGRMTLYYGSCWALKRRINHRLVCTGRNRRRCSHWNK